MNHQQVGVRAKNTVYWPLHQVLLIRLNEQGVSNYEAERGVNTDNTSVLNKPKGNVQEKRSLMSSGEEKQ